MEQKNVLLKKENGIAILTLNRPESMNALDLETLNGLEEAIEKLYEDTDIKIVILTGEGGAFCSGIDISLLEKVSSMGPSEFRVWLRGIQEDIFNKLENLEKPVIAAINGYALGAGCQLAQACDMRIASEKAALGLLEVDFGVIPDVGGIQRLPRLVGLGKAKELILTGDIIKAKEAKNIGLVNDVVAEADLERAVKELADKLLKKPPVALGLAKLVLNKSVETDLRSGLEYTVYAQGLCIQTEDHKESISAFFEKRKPLFKGK